MPLSFRVHKHLKPLAFASALSLISSGIAHAGEDQFMLGCGALTPQTNTAKYPGNSRIVLSNDLSRPTGKAERAQGQPLFVHGRIVDKNCVPVVNAIINVWHANPYGKHRYASRDELMNPEPIFAGSGRTVTDNMGRWHFTTLFPGHHGTEAPHIHFHITHPEFKAINTSMYFKNEKRNETDSRFKAFTEEQQRLLLGDVNLLDPTNPQAGLKATYDITLGGEHDYREY